MILRISLIDYESLKDALQKRDTRIANTGDDKSSKEDFRSLISTGEERLRKFNPT